MKVPLLDLTRQIKGLRPELLAALTEVVDSAQFILGPKVEALEAALARRLGVEHAIGVSSGTDALLVALMALKVGPGDLVLTTTYSFFATAGVVVRLGAAPVFLDIDPVSYNLSPEALSRWFATHAEERRRVKAIIAVHLYGQCVDMEAILAVGRQYGVPVVEDAAQALGAEYLLEGQLRQAGALGAAGCFSFFPTKNLGGLGEGGLVTTSDPELAHRVRLLRNHGAEAQYYHREVGGNFRLDAFQAAALLVKLPHLDTWNRRRQENAARYLKLFEEAGLLQKGLVTPPARVWQGRPGLKFDHIFHQFVIRVANRDRVREGLISAGIGCAIYYPVPFHRQECFKSLHHDLNACPEADQAAAETLALPIFPELTATEQTAVVEALVKEVSR